MNRPVDSSSAEECGVRRIHNGIHIEVRDVAAHDIDFTVGIFHEWST
jgi:hypothetical protein